MHVPAALMRWGAAGYNGSMTQARLVQYFSTSVALMAFGFLVARLAVHCHLMPSLRPVGDASHPSLDYWLGMVLAISGGFFTGSAARRFLSLWQGEPVEPTRLQAHSYLLASVFALVGLSILSYLVQFLT